jgi:hypothetical protein
LVRRTTPRPGRTRPARRHRRPRTQPQAAPDRLIALTCNEIRRLFVRFVIEPSRALACPQAWSHWRRRHQHRSRTSHYQRRDDLQPWT